MSSRGDEILEMFAETDYFGSLSGHRRFQHCPSEAMIGEAGLERFDGTVKAKKISYCVVMVYFIPNMEKIEAA